jgi:hypothetical protein
MTETRAVRSGWMWRRSVSASSMPSEGAGVAHARVLHLGGQDLLLGAVADQVEPDALQHLVVALAGAAGDDDVVLFAGVDAGVEAVHGQAHGGMDLGAEAVQRVGVAVLPAEERLHRLLDPRVHDGRGVVVQVDSIHLALHAAA